MSNKAMGKFVNHTLIGAFIIGAVIIITLGILFLGSGSLFKHSYKYVMYFTGSVKGLSVGAPVQLKGVTIGHVKEIHLVYNKDNSSFLNQVIFEVPEGSVMMAGGSGKQGPEKKRLSSYTAVHQMIENGLRGKLQLQSIVTGQLLVAGDFYPETEVKLMNFDDEYVELPTLPSDMDALAKTLDKIDVEGIAESLQASAKGIERLVSDEGLHQTMETVNETLVAYRQLAVNLDRRVGQLSTSVDAALTDFRQMINTADGEISPMATRIADAAADLSHTLSDLHQRLQPVLDNTEATTAAAVSALQQAGTLMDNLAYLSDEDSSFVYRIDEAMRELKKAAAALSVLAEYLGRHPESLLQGRQPDTKKEEK